MDVKWLDDFLALAECRSFTRAARLRNTSQSGLSRRIQSLEQWIGASLLNRDSQPLQLTGVGARFLPLAVNLRNAVIAARNLCIAGTQVPQSSVCLAVSEGMESGVLPSLLARMREQGCDVPVTVAIRDGDSAMRALIEGDIDMWLAPQHARLPLPLDPLSFEYISVAKDRLSPVTAPNSAGQPLYALPGSAAKPVPLLEHGATNYMTQVVGVALADTSARVYLSSVCVADSLHSLCALVRQGMGAAFLPESMVRESLRRGELVRAGPQWSAALDICLIRMACSEGRVPSETARRLWDCFSPALGRITSDVSQLARPVRVKDAYESISALR